MADGEYYRGQQPTEVSVYRTGPPRVVTTAPGPRHRPPRYRRPGLARGPWWTAFKPDPPPTIDSSILKLARMVATYVQGENIAGSGAHLIDRAAKEVQEQTVPFSEWVDDLKKTVSGVVSAIGRTVDPAEEPTKYTLSEVAQLIGSQLGPILAAMNPLESRVQREERQLREEEEAARRQTAHEQAILMRAESAEQEVKDFQAAQGQDIQAIQEQLVDLRGEIQSAKNTADRALKEAKKS